jgi:aconitate hydratase
MCTMTYMSDERRNSNLNLIDYSHSTGALMTEFDKNKFRKSFNLGNKLYHYYDIIDAASYLGFDIESLPCSLRILFENLLRNFDGRSVSLKDLEAFKLWINSGKNEHEIALRPVRVLMQDFTGVPAVVDLAAMRDAVRKLGGNPMRINPLSAVDLVIDHSVQVDHYGNDSSFQKNVKLEMERNIERYEFLRWGQKAFSNFRVVPPGTGICHQVNLEYLSKVVWSSVVDGKEFVFPDSLVGTDSHTTMVNGLGVLGWGVGGIEAEAVMLGKPISMDIPEVVGVELTGHMPEGITATDLVLTITNMLRKFGVVNKFVEFYGSGAKNLQLADRATIANMAPEYGATCGFFAVDEETISYMKLTGRSEEQLELTRHYNHLQKLWFSEKNSAKFSAQLSLDLSSLQPTIAGPKRPQDKVLLQDACKEFAKVCLTDVPNGKGNEKFAKVSGQDYKMANGDVVIAAITSCTNTSNPSVLIAAGLLAKKAAELGLKARPWVKTSLAPGSQVVVEYLKKSGLQKYLDELGFYLVGYGCTTCIGNSGPLKEEIEKSITENDLLVASVLSGNRNFEGRVHPLVKANFLASPPLVVAYAIAGSFNIDISKEPLAHDRNNNPVYLKDLWPSNSEIKKVIEDVLSSNLFREKYADVFAGDQDWQNISVEKSEIYNWNSASTYIQNPPYFDHMSRNSGEIKDIKDARVLAVFGDSITTDHISPAGNIAKSSPAAAYLKSKGVSQADFNSYGARRGNHEVMMRGTFANIRIKNEMLSGVEGGFTKYIPSGETLSIYDAAMKYKEDKRSLVIFAGKEYGTGSSRDWAAKGTMLLGVKAVVAESFERIHRSNLVRMGVLPFEFTDGANRLSMNLKGDETINISGLENELIRPKMMANLLVRRANGEVDNYLIKVRIDTLEEIEYLKHGGILQYVIRELL